MTSLLNEQEFTDHFTEAISKYNLLPSCKEPLVLELHYGSGEPVLTLSLKDAFTRYQSSPDQLQEVLQPYLQDLGWTVHEPRYSSKDLYEHSLPTLRNVYLQPFTENELAETADAPKGPLVFEQVLKAPSEYIVMQFSMYRDNQYMPLRKGDTLPCIPNCALLAQLSLHNLALSTENAGITATPLKFESLKAQSYLVGLGDENLKASISALSCIPAVMGSLEETFRAREGVIAIMPAVDQLIISIDTDEQSIVELGVLAKQLKDRATNPLSSLVWVFSEGNLEAVQALDLQEVEQQSEGDR